jgi:hypothetical protein
MREPILNAAVTFLFAALATSACASSASLPGPEPDCNPVAGEGGTMLGPDGSAAHCVVAAGVAGGGEPSGGSSASSGVGASSGLGSSGAASSSGPGSGSSGSGGVGSGGSSGVGSVGSSGVGSVGSNGVGSSSGP